MDFSAVRAECNLDDIHFLAEKAAEYSPIAVFVLPTWTPTLRDMLQGYSQISLGGVVGFPSGGETTKSKVVQAKELLELGCSELDMVMNIGKLRSAHYEDVQADIHAVVQTANNNPVKVILECSYLTDEQICQACYLSIKAGARFIKTGTGWSNDSSIPKHVSLMHSCVGETVGIKAAGGIRDLDTLMDLYHRGARRFGVGVNSAVNILKQCKNVD